MTRYLLLYTGPPPAGATHEGWPEWFEGIGDALLDAGSPMRNGFAVHADGAISDATSWPLGYAVIQAEDRTRVLELLRDHPLWRAGDQYTIEVFELPKR
jgi:hypothetical protein